MSDDDGLYFGPCLNPGVAARPLSDQEVTVLREAFLRKAGGPPKLLTPLPRRVRLRLTAESAINHAGTWLVYHGHYGAAERLWRLFGMWS